MIRQRDIWVLDVYLDEAGWDNQSQQIYFSTKRDAQAFARLLEQRIKERVGPNADQRLETRDVWKLVPYESFAFKSNELVKIANDMVDQWLEPLGR